MGSDYQTTGPRRLRKLKSAFHELIVADGGDWKCPIPGKSD